MENYEDIFDPDYIDEEAFKMMCMDAEICECSSAG